MAAHAQHYLNCEVGKVQSKHLQTCYGELLPLAQDRCWSASQVFFDHSFGKSIRWRWKRGGPDLFSL